MFQEEIIMYIFAFIMANVNIYLLTTHIHKDSPNCSYGLSITFSG